jgi:hypothetical protein
MFTVKTIKGNFKINFRHVTQGESRYTECNLMDENKFLLATGFAFCHKKDNFSRAVGRKLALTSVLASAFVKDAFDKAWKKEVWDEYFLIHKKGD